MESQVWALYAAAITATEAVNTQDDTVAARLQYTPNHVWYVANYGVHRGAAVALAVVGPSTAGGTGPRWTRRVS